MSGDEKSTTINIEPEPVNITTTKKITDNDEDPYIIRLKKSGCYESHIELQDCFYEKKDWRQCKDEMKKFKECFVNKSS
jgi:cytochrome c oxidase assembly factor 4